MNVTERSGGAARAPLSTRARRLARYIIPMLLLLYFAHGKLALNPVSRYERMADGLFYYQIAQHVAAGEGLLTSVSLYGQGLRELPAPTTVQPLWPLILGWSGRWLGLDRASEWVPEFFYFTSLVLLYVLGNRIGRSYGAEALVSVRGVPVLDVGTVGMALLGSNAAFSAYTSKAYTEGLAFALLFGALVALPRSGVKRPVAYAGAAGLLAGLAYLARSQLIGVPFAIAVALGVGGIREPRLRWAALASLSASVAIVVPWIVHLASSLRTFVPFVLVDFSAYRETEELLPLALVEEFPGLRERILDVLSSFAQPFDPAASYVDSFGLIAYSVPLCAGLLVYGLWRRRSRARRVPQAEHLVTLATVLAAVSTLVPLHLAHMVVGTESLFGSRHGLPLILAIVLAIAYLARLGAFVRIVLIAVAATGILFPAHTAMTYIRGNQRFPWPAERHLMRWLDAHPRPPVLLSLKSRSLAARSRSVAHQLVCTSPGLVMRQVEVLPMDYLVVYERDAPHCPFLFRLPEGEFDTVERFGHGKGQISVLRWRRSLLPAPTSPPRAGLELPAPLQIDPARSFRSGRKGEATGSQMPGEKRNERDSTSGNEE